MNNFDREMIVDKIACHTIENYKDAMYWLIDNGPKSVFKYRPGINIQIEKDNLFSNTTWLSIASEFNDPYDCSFIVDIAESENNTDEIRDADLYCKELQDEVCIGCFSNNFKSILMWSHYANYHQGFCIEYSLEELLYSIGIYPVFYTNQIIHPINYFKKEAYSNKILKLILSKSIEWSYEEEWRIIKPFNKQFSKDINPKGFKIEMPKPKAIYNGCRINQNLDLLNMLNEFSTINDVPLYEMKMERNKYELYY